MSYWDDADGFDSFDSSGDLWGGDGGGSGVGWDSGNNDSLGYCGGDFGGGDFWVTDNNLPICAITPLDEGSPEDPSNFQLLPTPNISSSSSSPINHLNTGEDTHFGFPWDDGIDKQPDPGTGEWGGSDRAHLPNSSEPPTILSRTKSDEHLVLERLQQNDPSLCCLLLLSPLSKQLIVYSCFSVIPLPADVISGVFPEHAAEKPSFIKGWPSAATCEALWGNTTLRSLFIAGFRLEQEQQKDLELMISRTDLKTLTICDSILPGCWRPELMSCIFCSNSLIYLSLNKMNMDAKWDEIGDVLAGNSSLTWLELSHNQIGENTALKIAQWLFVNSTLTKLDFSQNQIGEIGGQKLGQALAVNSTLRSLDLSSNGIEEVGGSKIGEGLAVNSTLTQLNLACNRLGNLGGIKVGEGLAVNSALTSLNLFLSRIHDAGGVKIAEGLAVNSTLTWLRLSSNQFGDIAGGKLGEGLACNSGLLDLDISDNLLGDYAGGKIAEGLAFNFSLTRLDLSKNELGKVAAGKIGEGLFVNSSLTQLDVNLNQFEFSKSTSNLIDRNKHNKQIKEESLFHMLNSWLDAPSWTIS